MSYTINAFTAHMRVCRKKHLFPPLVFLFIFIFKMKNRKFSTILATTYGVSQKEANAIIRGTFEALKKALHEAPVTINGFGRIRLSDITAPETFGSTLRKDITAIRFVPSDTMKAEYKKQVMKKASKKMFTVVKKPVKKAKK